MERRIVVLALFAVAGCAGAERGVVKPSALDPSLAPLDREAGRSLEYPVVEIDRFDGFLGEAARVEATVGLARRQGGELRAAVLDVAKDRKVPRAEERAWTALARELAARDDLTPAQRERLDKAAAPLPTLVTLLAAVPDRAQRLVADGTALIDGAHATVEPGDARRLAPALDALNVAVNRLREDGARAPNLAAELALALDGLGGIAPRAAPPEVQRARAEVAPAAPGAPATGDGGDSGHPGNVVGGVGGRDAVVR